MESQGQVRVFLLAERESHLPIDLDFMAVGSYSELAKDVFIDLLFEAESGPFQQLVFSSFEENLRWGKRYFKAEFGLVIILVDVVESEEVEKFMETVGVVFPDMLVGNPEENVIPLVEAATYHDLVLVEDQIVNIDCGEVAKGPFA